MKAKLYPLKKESLSKDYLTLNINDVDLNQKPDFCELIKEAQGLGDLIEVTIK